MSHNFYFTLLGHFPTQVLSSRQILYPKMISNINAIEKRVTTKNALSVLSHFCHENDDDSTIDSTVSSVSLKEEEEEEEAAPVTSTSEEQGMDEVAKRRAPKSVSFSGFMKIQLISSLAEYSKEEYELTWYTREEFQDLRRRCKDRVKLLEYCKEDKIAKKNKNLFQSLSGGDCERGLERYLPSRIKSRSKKREAAIQAVLGTQELVQGRFFGSSDDINDDADDAVSEEELAAINDHKDTIIASLYGIAASDCQKWANLVGYSDERAVLEQRKQDEEEEAGRR